MITSGLRGPGWRVAEARADHVKVIRDWITSAIARHECAVDPDDAALAVGELFTNAVMHGPAGGRVLVGYWLWPAGARFVVCDGGSSGVPRVRQVTNLAEGGRGLQVVDAVSAQWGDFSSAGNLVVWCDFGELPRIPDGDAWAWLHQVLAAEGPLSARHPRQALPEPGPQETGLTTPPHAAMSCTAGSTNSGMGFSASTTPPTAPALTGGGRER